jgi:hypothetical protein
MNKQAVRLNIESEELALANPESVQAMHLAISKVLNEIDQARAQARREQEAMRVLGNMSVVQLVQRLHALVG